MHFYTLKEAAAAIAAELYPADAIDDGNDPRADVERRYLAALQNAVCENEIVYRDPDARLPIRQDGIAAFMTSHWCVVNVADLNAWLQAKGVDIKVPSVQNDSDILEESANAAHGADVVESDWPTSAQLAAAFGPFLVDGRDDEWLKRRLNDADRYTDLLKYRRKEGRRPVARWNAGGVTVYLIALGKLSWMGAKAALEKHYPESLGVLEGLGQREEMAPAQWCPTPRN
ncbi:hypothetical protein WM11_31495 [Burkholderia ubonensis]|uniref:hypothetical protein n=1 Tax=Burkholderia ubonensis TaxID=101571 RepID=UPI00075B359D|nr:hypothetical protein [Burkholderia ubonensis]KVR46383.1 hypothetical protein WK18_12715 [Burkholderia ubonensis]KWB74507.1 hypothetical protein WL41_15245 [Burkholderia ubonensis]KWC20039.1 hypothetical protein WL46_21945 [Burkholderia ubonensis]KWK12948.1 hypothetical protein WM11_31495 [Burkholderia ubonensis]KWK47824.1 hypothetical protein WM14_06230 [Burkholderia ubonensis]